MTILSRAVTATSTATLLTAAADPTGEADLALAIKNVGAATVYLGGLGVTTAAGYPLAAGEALGIDLSNAHELVYGITASGSSELRIMSATQ